MWAAKWAEQLVERGCGQLPNGQNSLLREDILSQMGRTAVERGSGQLPAEWAEQLVERGCGQLNGQNSLLREDVGS